VARVLKHYKISTFNVAKADATLFKLGAKRARGQGGILGE
jgi:hypothetical protein